MMSPIVVSSTTITRDGKVNQNDILRSSFAPFTGGGYYKQGTLHAVRSWRALADK
jgi:hypothetical protein